MAKVTDSVDEPIKIENTYICQKCKKIFHNKAKARIHYRIHTGERPFPCSWPGCQKRFVQKEHLTKHMSTHTGEKKFKCNNCDYQCFAKAHMTLHIRHRHSGERPFSCPICCKKFVSSSDLSRHSTTHSGEKKFQCNFCKYRSNRKLHLVSHIRRKHQDGPRKRTKNSKSAFLVTDAGLPKTKKLSKKSRKKHQKQYKHKLKNSVPEHSIQINSDEFFKHKLQYLDQWWPKDLDERNFLTPSDIKTESQDQPECVESDLFQPQQQQELIAKHLRSNEVEAATISLSDWFSLP